MAEKITNKQVQEFLKDFKEHSETILLTEGKETDELFEIAASRGISLKDNKDLAGVKFIYTFADIANKNRARLPKKELLKALPTLIGKPLDIDHDRRYVIGAFLDYRYIVKDEMVIAYAVIYKSNFADEWDEMQKLFVEGKLATSYEIWSDGSKRIVLEDGTYELHDMTIAGGAILLKENPAFPGAKVLELAKKRMAQSPDLVFASELKSEDLIIAEERISKAAEDKIDNAAILTAVEGEKKVETKKEEVVVAPEVKVEAAAIVEAPKVETPKTEEKIAEATVLPVVEIKTEEVVKAEEVKVEAPIVEEAKKEEDMKKCSKCGEPMEKETEECKKCAPKQAAEETKPVEEAKTVIEETKVTVIADAVKDQKAGTVEQKTTTVVATTVTDTYKTEQPVAVVSAEEVKVVECAKCKELEEQVKFYKENAVEIAKRRSELGEMSKDISDIDILDNAKFSDAKVIKANAELTVSKEVVGVKVPDVDNYKKYQDEISAKAEGRVKRTH